MLDWSFVSKWADDVSAVMMRNLSDEVLEGFSQSISPFIDYDSVQDGFVGRK